MNRLITVGRPLILRRPHRLAPAQIIVRMQRPVRVAQQFAGEEDDVRLTGAQNVLGLVYLDDNRANDAAHIFYDNYSKLPDGDRAPDSLLNLAKSLTAMKRPATDICQVYKELGDVYGDKLSAGQKAEADRGRATYKCK